MSESELKLVIDAETGKTLWRRARAAGLTGAAPRPRLLRSVYFDNADHALRRARIALRLRRDGRRWLQTVKAKGEIHGGLSRTEESETPAPGGRLDLALIADGDLRARIETLTASGLAPVCETEIRRASGVVALAGTRAELAVDSGEIIAGERRAALHEAEIEHLDGPLSGLFEIARALFPEGGLKFSRISKSQRGYLLAEEGGIGLEAAPRNAVPAPVGPGMTAEEAAQAALRECLDQIAANGAATLESDDPEAVHQLRVGLRRLRSVFDIFGPAIAGKEAARLEGEANWLAGAAGHLRDLDVVATELVARESKAAGDDPGFRALGAAMAAAAAAERRALRQTLRSQRMQAFLLDLAQFSECRGWLSPDDIGQTARLAADVKILARDALDQAWRRARRRARGLEDLDIEARHDLRKALKKLRYTVEFLSELYSRKKYLSYQKKLKLLQDTFGDLNDAAMVAALFDGPDAPAAADPAAQRAIGRVIGASGARAEAAWPSTARLWSDLAASPRFW
ncbi:MAG: CHAD domain-containing protein [Pikeienuella sp.]